MSTPTHTTSQSHLGKILSDLPIGRKLAIIVVVFCLIIGSLLSLNHFGMSVLSDVRAYVGGEGLWSKAQKDAVYYLMRYTILHEEDDFQKYLFFLKVPLGDRKARLELENPTGNLSVIGEGFIEGRNSPEDVEGMARLFRRFHEVSYIEDAIAAWSEADKYLSELIKIGEEVRVTVQSSKMSPQRTKEYLKRIDDINAKLTPMEDAFSFTLGEGARWLKRSLLTTMLIVTVVLSALGIGIAFLISRRLVMEIYSLRSAAAEIAQGNYKYPIQLDSRDEIGDLAKSFREMAAHRAKAERLKDEFFATVSHELRTPLTLILSPLESLMASEYGDMSDRQRHTLGTMHNNAIRLLQMVNGLLDFSKLEAGRIEVNRQATEVVSLTRSIFSDFQSLMKSKKIGEIFESDVDSAVVSIDRYLYERILFNLLSNAVKFTPEGGTVKLFLTWANNQLKIAVSDTGIGISKENVPFLFHKFNQLEGASTRRFEGTGLGLALVKEFSGLMGGSVSVQSEFGKGSTFTLELQAPQTTVEMVSDEMRSSKTKMIPQYLAAPMPLGESVGSDVHLPKVLIAEDNAELASYVTSLLEPFCQIHVAKDGVEALAEARQWNPDLIISDVMMPKKDGLTLCRDIKSAPETNSILFVLMTALTHRDALLKGWEAGADDYLFKPFHPKELTMRIKSMLKTSYERRQGESEIRLLNQELEKKVEERTHGLRVLNEELQQFAFVASHDLREPLRKIRIFLDMMKQEGIEVLTPHMLDLLARVQGSAERMEQLIESLFQYSRVNRQEPLFASVDLNVVIKEALADLEIAVSRSGATIDVDNMPLIKGDMVQLRQLIQNLIGNALKFRSIDRPLVITVRGMDEGNGFYRLSVQDNGIGFDERFSDLIFKPFERLHGQNKYEGIGMGLTICQKIIRRHRGQISGKSKEGEGSVFTFTLPLYSSEGEQA